MRPEPDITRVVRSWLVEGTDRLPDRVLDSVLDRVPATPQRRPSWSAWRFSVMLTPARLALAAVAIIVASVATLALLPRSSGPGTTTPAASPSQPPTPLPAASATSSVTAVRPAGEMDAGRYSIAAPFPMPFALTFPSSWTLKGLSDAEANFVRSTPAENAAWITVDLVNGVMVDPCHADGGPMSPAPTTVDGVVAGLRGLVGFNAGPVTDVSIGGIPAKSFQITNSIDTDTANCTYGPMLPLFTIPGSPVGGGTNGGATERLWVLAVHGTIVVIDGETFPNTPAAAVEEIPVVVGSIVFE